MRQKVLGTNIDETEDFLETKYRCGVDKDDGLHTDNRLALVVPPWYGL